MTDFHTHILPGMDDGAASEQESQAMLESLLQQGVSSVVLTPHFYPLRQTTERFLAARREAFLRLCVPPSMQVHLGAEVHYHSTLGSSSAITALSIEGTDVLLLELPYHSEPVQDKLVDHLNRMSLNYDITPVIAHIDRYPKLCKNERFLYALCEIGVFFQVNAQSICDRTQNKRLFHLMQKGYIHLLGSDCHNMKERSPCMKQAMQAIEEQLGRSMLYKIEQHGRDLLGSSLKAI